MSSLRAPSKFSIKRRSQFIINGIAMVSVPRKYILLMISTYVTVPTVSRSVCVSEVVYARSSYRANIILYKSKYKKVGVLPIDYTSRIGSTPPTFYTSICISTLPTQHTTFIILYYMYTYVFF